MDSDETPQEIADPTSDRRAAMLPPRSAKRPLWSPATTVHPLGAANMLDRSLKARAS